MIRKLWICILILLSCAQFSYALDNKSDSTQKNIHIEKSDLGFNIYSMNNELILKLANNNCDSTELALLDYMYKYQNEINVDSNSDKQGKIILVNKENKKDFWDYLLVSVQILVVSFTGLALLHTIKKAKKDDKISKLKILTMEEELNLQKEEHLISIRPYFQVNSRLIPDNSYSPIKRCKFNLINSGERAYNVNLKFLGNNKMLNLLGIQSITENVDYGNLEKNFFLFFEIGVPTDAKISTLLYSLYFNDSVGHRYKQSIIIKTDGFINIGDPILLENKEEGITMSDGTEMLVGMS
ncbi:MAG: hypothetical protein PHN88_14325 [Ignavibacteria bacterium]|nr:hypothetical protein [Ignavibacteria bacterium]